MTSPRVSSGPLTVPLVSDGAHIWIITTMNQTRGWRRAEWKQPGLFHRVDRVPFKTYSPARALCLPLRVCFWVLMWTSEAEPFMDNVAWWVCVSTQSTTVWITHPLSRDTWTVPHKHTGISHAAGLGSVFIRKRYYIKKVQFWKYLVKMSPKPGVFSPDR